MSNQNTHLSLHAQRAAAVELALQQDESVFTVASDCMAPRIPVGARVRIQKCSAGDIHPGDAVLLNSGTRLYLHRFLGFWHTEQQKYLLCKSDQRLRPDRPWPASCLAGKAIGLDNHSSAGLRAGNWWPRCYCLLTKLALACGLLPIVEEKDNSLSVAFVNVDWRLMLCRETHKEKERLSRLLRSAAPASLSGTINITLAETLPEISTAGEEIVFSGKRLRVRLDPAERNGEVFGTGIEDVIVGLESLFRAFAIYQTARDGGVALHASSVAIGDGAYLFAGASGTGKTTCAQKFSQQLDEDQVLVVKGENDFVRIPHTPMPGGGDEKRCRLKAVFLPRKSTSFSLTRLTGTEAMVQCLHLPPWSQSEETVTRLLQNVEGLVEQVPVYLLAWDKNMNLPQEIEQGLKPE